MPSNDKDQLEPCSYKPRNNHGIAAATSSGNLREGRPPACSGGHCLANVSRLEWKVLSGWHLSSNLKTQNTTYSHLRMELFPAHSGCQRLAVFSDTIKNISTKRKKRSCACEHTREARQGCQSPRVESDRRLSAALSWAQELGPLLRAGST